MADSILRLKVESQEYDNKLKQATNGLTRYVDECRKVGGTLEVVEKETLDYVRALGQMDTTSRTATGKLAEMKKAFTELSAQYKQMTDEEKNSPFGKALATSLDQLKGRIGESKVQLDDINKSINGGGGLTGALDNLAGKFGMSVQSLASWGTALAAAKAALDVAKDAFFASEANVDEWGRTMQAAEGIYEGFLNALNTGDISGYLSRIDEIVNAARAAYNELDRLGTMKTIQGPQMSAQQTENERMRMMIQTGRYIAPLDGRRATMQNGQLLTPEQIRRIEQQLQNGMQKVVGLVGNEVKQTGRAIDKYYDSLAKQNGMTLQEFKKGTSSMAEYDKRMEGYRKYQEWNDKAAADYYRQGGRNGFMNFDNGNPYLEFKKWGVFRVDKEGKNSLNDLVNLIKQRDQQTSQAYSTLSQSYRAINRAEGITVKKILGGDGVGGKGGAGGGSNKTPKTEEQLNNEEIQKLTQEYIKASDDRRKAIEGEIKTLQDRNKEIARLKDMALGKIGDDGSLSAMTQQLKELQSAQSESASGREWDDYQKKIDDVTARINVLKGVLPKDQQATFTVTVNAEELEQLRMLLPSDEETVRINVEEGRIDLPDIPTEIEQVVNTKVGDVVTPEIATDIVQTISTRLGSIVTPDIAETLTQVINTKVGDVVTPEIAKELTQVINVEPGTVNLPELPKEDETIRVNITATTADAMKEVRDMVGEIEGWQVAIEPKIEIKEQDLRTPFEKLKDILKIEIAEENMQVDTTTLQTLMKTAIQNSIDGIDPNFSALQEKMREGMNIPDETWQELQDEINKKLKGLGIEPIKIDFKTGNIANDGKGGGNKSDVDGFKNFNEKFSQLNSGVGSIVSGIQQMGVEIPKELQSTLSVLQGISTIMTGVLAIITVMNAKQTAQTAMSFIPFYAHGGLVHAATGYMVPGNDHADRTLIAASSGELILNRAQQGVIASQLENGNGGGMHVVGEIQGEKIVLVANRFLKRSGQGELVTWK